jgi:hypothetical protein
MSKSKKKREEDEEEDRTGCFKPMLTIWLICLFIGGVVWLITCDIEYFIIIGISIPLIILYMAT